MNTSRTLVALVATFATALASAQHNHIQVHAELAAAAKVGANRLNIVLADHDGKPVKDATVTLSVNMATMDMGVQHPPATNNKDGSYSATVTFSMAGPWKVTVSAKSPTVGEGESAYTFDTGGGMQMGDMGEMGAMKGRLGNWGMQKEGSGTSWLPESSPMFMKGLGNHGGFDQSAMGFITYNYTDAGGKRGDHRFFSNSMLMLMGQKGTEKESLGYSLMFSLDPVFNGEFGYPDLFQTGETAYGNKLTDFQHPHDLLVEVAGTYSREVGKGVRAFLYGGPVAEPALGGPTFMHRISGVEIPEAPISHHWFDSTHIAWGVVTLGVNTQAWQVEGSVFNGHEPDENRYSPDKPALNSASGRVTFAPNKDTALSASYGYLNSPESTEPGVDQHRLTAAIVYNRPLGDGANLATTLAFGRNIVLGENSDALLLEATYMRGHSSYFVRWENVDKNELGGVPPGSYKVNKILFGGVREVSKFQGLDLGVGAYAGVYAFPSSLDPFYGSSPVTFGVFVRLRPSQMDHSMHMGH